MELFGTVIGANGKFLKFIQGLYQDSLCCVKIGSVVSEELDLEWGIWATSGMCVITFAIFSMHQ